MPASRTRASVIWVAVRESCEARVVGVGLVLRDVRGRHADAQPDGDDEPLLADDPAATDTLLPSPAADAPADTAAGPALPVAASQESHGSACRERCVDR